MAERSYNEENLKWSGYTESDNTDVFTNRHATQDPEHNSNVDIIVDGEGPGIVNVKVLDREKFGKNKSSGSIQINVSDIVGTTHNRVIARSDKKMKKEQSFKGRKKRKKILRWTREIPKRTSRVKNLKEKKLRKTKKQN